MGVGTTAALAVGGAVGGIVAAPFVLGALGFTAAGITAGSFAASMMAASGSVAAGSTVAVLQSAGAAGIGSFGAGVAATIGGGTVAVVKSIVSK